MSYKLRLHLAGQEALLILDIVAFISAFSA